MTVCVNSMNAPMSATLELAQQALSAGLSRVTDDYRPDYHLAPPAGWMNDPNGVVYFRGEYHVFYQHHPFDAKWGPMYWGHAKSADLVHWQHLPIALAPGDDFDRDGCFSGSAVVCDDTLALIYTGHTWLGEVGDERRIRQVQCLATSVDGIRFVKHGAVIETAPQDTIMHFRDPKVWKDNDDWYLIAGARLGDKPLLPLYRSTDLRAWEFLDYVSSGNEGDGYMWECPDLFRLDGRDVLLYSPQGMHPEGYERLNKYQTGYRVGQLDRQWHFNGGPFIELDNGHDFYAAQTLEAADGRRLVWAWLDMWESPMPSQAHHWCGMLGLPRELQLHADRLRVFPARELTALRKAPLPSTPAWGESGSRWVPQVNGDRLEIHVQLNLLDCTEGTLGIALRCSADGDEYTLLYYDASLQRLVLDRSRSGAQVSGQRSVAIDREQESLQLRVFLDRSSIEVFEQSGRFSLSSRIYPQPDSLGVKLLASGTGGDVAITHAWPLASGWL
ncbi:glycoside hydrolase family 32 protein [Pseudomonas fluorescens]|uniref:Sucrose-6-phosphate hydrolase n=1 Tax=Pseudomonas fluorescens TaxID=294 RepID=A0A944DLW5_PSEFL|nr:glycoside hydrolase family 32 protein [Pseudomonas fluorescens]MBT2295944.1 glycoside hydrolase family 32 protein [Pseudomonas fluorescens]MBT2306200.1 glycoside hydrolase family 32 protein [Pseudomonas fluorescens]MBT2314443.1 glycoside hydrolase family 32 protein [Pseudomonas fluorescens]MBT2315808.1 glycoside hydrolase family 32 protein [Pseudomonas fluorescens]MBT2330413.1 glycoside hydrolase family 32 protein [Pseudomonas fluorescens]